jgi:hypothetical protein
MPSKKASSADNQQERLTMANWLVGFVDGEGSFLISFLRNKTTRYGWQVFPEFVVTQGAKSFRTLEEIKSFFGCGHVFINRRSDNHHEHLYRFCIRSAKDLRDKVIPFFERHKLRTAKQKDFQKFKQVLNLMKRGVHLKERGIEKIRDIARTMNRKGIKNR